jgi:hypothetical protein
MGCCSGSTFRATLKFRPTDYEEYTLAFNVTGSNGKWGGFGKGTFQLGEDDAPVACGKARAPGSQEVRAHAVIECAEDSERSTVLASLNIWMGKRNVRATLRPVELICADVPVASWLGLYLGPLGRASFAIRQQE